MIVGIIGAGASGMAAALAAAENPEIQVLLFERQARVGRKLQATGNGRCNLSNIHAVSDGYHGQQAEFSNAALQAFPPEKTLQWFYRLGLITTCEPSGRVYPYSDQANSVVDVLRFALQKPNISLLTGFEVEKITIKDGRFLIEGNQGSHFCDRLIIACGGLAGTKLGGSLSGYKLLKTMGHRITKLRPSLVQIKSNWAGVVALKGVRANCDVKILCNNEVFAQSAGELQFTEYGVSGPVIFEISRDVCQQPGKWVCRLDFLPNMEEAELFSILCSRKDSALNCEELLTGILHNRLGRVLVQSMGIKLSDRIAQLSNADLRQICGAVKAFDISLVEPMGMDHAQVTAGGAVTDDFDPETMESRLVPGLYACGEVLDIDGDCGGYNLQWAWSSGYLAGRHAGGLKV